MSKRHSDRLAVGRKAKRQRRNVYFVINDGDGYAIRKVDLSLDYDSDDDAKHHKEGTIDATELPLPRVLIRFHDSFTSEFFAASGTKILVAGCCLPKRAVPTFDVHTRTLSLGPRLKACPHQPLFMPIGRNLVSLDSVSTQFLDPPQPENITFEWSWRLLTKAPFERLNVTCHAQNPDGRTLFVSTLIGGSPATFTLDTDTGLWKQYSNWKLPFKGQVHFDPALGAWVGFAEAKKHLGFLCPSDVASIDAVASSSNMQPSMVSDLNVVSISPDTRSKVQSMDSDDEDSSDDDSSSDLPPIWRLSKEKIFCEDPAEQHHGAALVYMGGRSKYCLLQCFSVLDENNMHIDDEDDTYQAELKEEDLPRRHLLRLTTFTLKYTKIGELSIAKRRRVRCYELPPDADTLFADIPAFLI